MKTENLQNHNRPNSSLGNMVKQKQYNSCQTIQSETKEEFLNRQREYDKLYKYSYYPQLNPKNSKARNYSKTINQIRQQVLQKREALEKFIIQKDDEVQQQSKSIQIIAELFRQQKKAVLDKQLPFKPQIQQYNLLIILVIMFPIICILTVLAELR